MVAVPRNTRRSAFLAPAIIALLLPASQADPIVIGGSSLTSPPPFWVNSFWGMTPSIDRAFLFHVIPGVAYSVGELQVAAFHYEGSAGDQASFSINTDAGGQPGEALVAFEVTQITTTPRVFSALPAASTEIQADSWYWLVGRTPYGQVNWNLGDNAFGTAAYRVSGGAWQVLTNTNLSAFAVLGSPVPEPSNAWLAGVLALAGARIRR